MTIANGVTRYAFAAIEGYAATVEILISTGVAPAQALKSAKPLAKRSIHDVIREQLSPLSAAGQTTHLASLPPVREEEMHAESEEVALGIRAD